MEWGFSGIILSNLGIKFSGTVMCTEMNSAASSSTTLDSKDTADDEEGASEDAILSSATERDGGTVNDTTCTAQRNSCSVQTRNDGPR